MKLLTEYHNPLYTCICRLFVRIKPEITYQLGEKFGCSVSGAIELLKLAQTLELNVTGVRYVHETYKLKVMLSMKVVY